MARQGETASDRASRDTIAGARRLLARDVSRAWSRHARPRTRGSWSATRSGSIMRRSPRNRTSSLLAAKLARLRHCGAPAPHEPVARILGVREFWGCRTALTRKTGAAAGDRDRGRGRARGARSGSKGAVALRVADWHGLWRAPDRAAARTAGSPWHRHRYQPRRLLARDNAHALGCAARARFSPATMVRRSRARSI